MTNLFLIEDTAFGNLWWVIGGAVVLIAMILYYNKVKKDQAELQAAEHDAYSHVVNDSNYNINREGVDGHRTENMNRTEAKEALDDFKETREMPTDSEFHEIQRDLKKS